MYKMGYFHSVCCFIFSEGTHKPWYPKNLLRIFLKKLVFFWDFAEKDNPIYIIALFEYSLARLLYISDCFYLTFNLPVQNFSIYAPD